jgi:hypothetical protein
LAKVPADEVRRQLGSLFGRAVEALGEVRNVVVRTSQVGKIKLDATFLRRERDRLFARLGEAVFDRVEAGQLSLADDVLGLVEQIREVERRLEEQEAEIAAVEAEALARRQAHEASRREAEELAASMREGKWEEPLPDEEPMPGTAEPSESADGDEKTVDFATGDVVKEAPPSATPPAPRRRRGGRRTAAASGGGTPGAGDEEL